MCSIIGYSGDDIAAPIIVKGLRRMEYRGYDSVGVATESNNQIELKKGVGKVEEVNSKVNLEQLPGKIGIGHTRWATHGKVTDANAHPHPSTSGKIAIVHNGIIENFVELKENLKNEGFIFQSDTDSEVIANLLQKNFELSKNVKDAMLKTISELKGHYSFIAMFENGQLAAARFHEPLIIGVGKNNYFLSSDVLGFIEQTDEAIYMDNGNFAIINQDQIQILDFQGNEIKPEITKVSKEFADVYKGDYAHFTLKEISEQPETIFKAGENTKNSIKAVSDYLKHSRNIYLTGSGTSYNASLVAKYLLAKYAKIKSESIISSELQFSPDSIEPNSIVIAISQSGESADVLEAVNIAKKNDCKIISIINSMTSTLSRESDIVIGMNCGPEIGVAATKSFTSQLIILYKIIQELNGDVEIDLDEISSSISKILEEHNNIKKIANALKEISDIYVLGRGIHYPIAIESALKIKELTYIHAEGIAGGELKHGPLALMDDNVFVIIINPEDSTYQDTLTSAREIKARGAKIIGISDKESDAYDYWVKIPKTSELTYPIAETIPIQLLSYYCALEKDTDPDYPRNLAKSVTVK
ncbi:MAG: glutamine--fructose-6-phosphate transaminase (isomerizing) [Nitrosopumilaceae archaeon]|uniref:Glutamine--fructose-6-phosphate transaminase (Isomerizing) n=2 Tax=Candidatus Nitrosomaritimum aestuariumsis TaxID=3342354 RepID=A0AC60VYI5_9ARCH|nr:glutamine--fructose-6-phosphate transaminase (isomerizing) [Nitrosopumilaceae archaeon]MBA4460476.1 glutamine--fructose-6-phosphate transaminase (isomerizing) [Nitrosopumilaceae archaeon]MBA4462804.1 glutamine--fructose-6-phosphate transaminase (isomerizing) [Nitrosopumilaceae archaeon]